MISLVFLILYWIVTVILYVAFDVDVILLIIVSPIVGYLYAYKIEPWIYGIDTKDIIPKKKLRKVKIWCALISAFAGTISIILISLTKHISSGLSGFRSDLVYVIGQVIAIYLIPIIIIVAFKITKKKVSKIIEETA